jgi:hypothetical protein
VQDAAILLVSNLREGAAVSFRQAAEFGFHEAREKYTAGYKSSNKLKLKKESEFTADRHNYSPVGFADTETEQDLGYIQRLRVASFEVRNFRSSYKPSGKGFLAFGKDFLKLTLFAANCGELSMMAAAKAWEVLGKPAPPPVALAELKPPADHVFCAVGDRQLLERLDDKTVSSLSERPVTEDAWAVDPWLNVCCKLEDYPARAEAKLDKWHMANKRIAWTGPQGPGWYPALGDYSRGFAAARLKIVMG